MRCKNCGEKLPKGCTFCSHCNTPVQKKQSLTERTGKVPIIIGTAAIAIAAVGVLFFALTNVPAVTYEPDAPTAKYVTKARETTFFDTSGNVLITIENIDRELTNSLGTAFYKTSAGELYKADSTSCIKCDEGLTDTRMLAAAANADTVYYEKSGRLYRYDGEVTDIARIYGVSHTVTVSPDGTCAAWGTVESGVNKTYVYRGGNVEELSGAEEIVSAADGGMLMYGTADGSLVMCSDGARSFVPVAKCGAVKAVSADCRQVIFTDEHNPASNYLYDPKVGEPVFLYRGSVSICSPEGMHPVTDSFDLFIAEATDPRAGTQSLMLFRRDGASYKTRTLLDLNKVSKYRISSNGDKLLYLKDGTLSLKSLTSSFSRESVIAENVSEILPDSSLSDIFFLSSENELYLSDGGSLRKISLNVGAAVMLYDGICTFADSGRLYWCGHDGTIQKTDGIGTVKFLTQTVIVSDDEEQYITFDGKTFINTGINRF